MQTEDLQCAVCIECAQHIKRINADPVFSLLLELYKISTVNFDCFKMQPVMCNSKVLGRLQRFCYNNISKQLSAKCARRRNIWCTKTLHRN